MTSSLTRIVPTVLCVAAMTLLAGCTDEVDNGADAASGDSDQQTPQAALVDATGPGAQSAPADSLADTRSGGNTPTDDGRGVDPRMDMRGVDLSSGDVIPDRGSQALSSEPGLDPRGRGAADLLEKGTEIIVVAEPTILDLGELAPREQLTGIVTLRNTGDHPMMIEGSRTDCGCTVANVPQGTYLQPGESVDVDVSLRGGAREQRLSKNVTFFFSDQPDVRVQVQGHVRTFVTIAPEFLNPEQGDDGTLTIRAEDDQPFRIVSVHPDVLEEKPENPAVEHTVRVSWEKWDDQRQARRLLFYLDHPKTNQVMANVRVVPTRATDPLRQHQDRSIPERPNLPQLVHNGEVDQVVRLLNEEGMDVNATDASGTPLLALAARRGNPDMVRALLDADADVNASDRTGRTVLMAAGQSRNPEVMRLLIDAGADVNARDTTIGATALAWAAGFGDSDSVRLLLEAGAEVEAVSNATGFTPLIWACGFGEDESVRLLIEAGGNTEATDFTQGLTPLIHAARRGSSSAIQLLVDAGVDIARADANGRNALMWAAGSRQADVEAVNALVKAGIDVNATDRRGLTALDHARTRNDPNAADVIRKLQELTSSGDDEQE